MTKKSISTNKPFCQLCVYWSDLPRQKSVSSRFCPYVKEFREKKDEVCDFFELRNMFWCVKNGQFRSSLYCIQLRNNQVKEGMGEQKCLKCKQGKTVENALKRSKINQIKRKRSKNHE